MEKKIVVAFVFFDADFRTSVLHFTQTLAALLKGPRIEPVLVCLRKTSRKATDEGIPIVSLNGPKRAAILAAPSLARFFAQSGIDVAVSSTTGPNFATALAALLCRRKGRHKPRTVLVNHNTFSRNEGSNPVKRALAGWLYPRADGVVAVSRGIRDDLVRLFPRLAPATRVVYNPLLTPPEKLESLKAEAVDHPWFRDGSVPVVLNIAELFPRKDHKTLLRAFARVVRQRDARLAVLGHKIEPTYGELAALREELGLKDRVEFLGFHKNPFKYLARSAAFVLSSVEEGFGLVLVEAMACGCPVVSTDCPSGPPEIVAHERNGLLVKPRDPEALARAVTRVLEDGELRETLRKNGFSRAADFNLETFAEGYRSLVLQVSQEGAWS